MTSDEKNISLSRAKKSRFVKGQERIETILDAAREVFVESGYNKLTMRQVALVAGITVGNLNYYYQTKEALFLGIPLSFIQIPAHARGKKIACPLFLLKKKKTSPNPHHSTRVRMQHSV